MHLDIITNGERCWPDLIEGDFTAGRWVALARLPNGTISGNSTVTARIELPNGQTVLAETSLALLTAAVDAFRAAEGGSR